MEMKEKEKEELRMMQRFQPEQWRVKLLFAEMVKTTREADVGREVKQGFCSDEAEAYKSLVFSGKVWTGDINLGVISAKGSRIEQPVRYEENQGSVK